MRKLVFLLPWALLLSACASQPERVAKDFTQALSEGDTARALESVDPEIRKQSDRKLTFLLDAAARESDARGGLKSVATESVSERGDQARVRMTTVYHNGATETKIVRLRRVGGRWYLSI